MSVTKKDIVKHIAKKYDLHQGDTKNVVQEFLDTVIQTLAAEERLELRDFGIFQVKERARRKARNPKTGRQVSVPARKVVTFKPGKKMAEQVRDAQNREEPEDTDDTPAS